MKAVSIRKTYRTIVEAPNQDKEKLIKKANKYIKGRYKIED